MKNFLTYLLESSNYDPSEEIQNSKKSEARYPMSHGGWNVVTRIHAASQAHLRRPDFKKEDWQELHKKVLDHIKEKSVPNGEHIFYSGKKRQGYVAEVNHEKKQLKVITTLDPGSSRVVRPNTGKHIVENIELQVFEID